MTDQIPPCPRCGLVESPGAVRMGNAHACPDQSMPATTRDGAPATYMRRVDSIADRWGVELFSKSRVAHYYDFQSIVADDQGHPAKVALAACGRAELVADRDGKFWEVNENYRRCQECSRVLRRREPTTGVRSKAVR